MRGAWTWTGSQWIHEETKSRALGFSQQGPQREASAQGQVLHAGLPWGHCPQCPLHPSPQRRHGLKSSQRPALHACGCVGPEQVPCFCSHGAGGLASPKRARWWRRPLGMFSLQDLKDTSQGREQLSPSGRQSAMWPKAQFKLAQLERKRRGRHGWEVQGRSHTWPSSDTWLP